MIRKIVTVYKLYICPLLNLIYLKILIIYRVIVWKIRESKNDVDFLMNNCNCERLHIYRPQEWHNDIKYFWTKQNDKKVFIKITNNCSYYINEQACYEYLEYKNSKLILNIPKAISFNIYNNKYYMLFEFVSASTLLEMEFSKIKHDDIQKIIIKLLDLYYLLYRHNICHNNIRMDKFFVCEDQSVLLFDFKYSCILNDMNKSNDIYENRNFMDYIDYSQSSKNMIDDAYSFLNVMKKVNGELYSDQHDIWKYMNQMTGKRLVDLDS